MLRIAKSVGFVSGLFLLVHCGGAEAPSSDDTSTTGQDMSTAIHTTYGLTTFGGPGDYQTLACTNANSKNDQPWFVASSQRYGCGVHLKITTASGKCVVARTDDAGPASFVESRAGIAVLDSSPSVTKYLFGITSGLGYSDLRDHPGRYNVTAVKTTLPLGPCDGSASGGTSSGGTSSGGSSSGGSSGGGSSSGGSSGSGAACSTDGQCNPGNDGSGMICSGGQCVAGCHSDAQCPGNTTCVSGSCE
jgi:hypothetical protein